MGIINCCDARETKILDERLSITKDTFNNKDDDFSKRNRNGDVMKSKAIKKPTPKCNPSLSTEGKMPNDFYNFTNGNKAQFISNDECDKYINPVIRNVRKDNEDLSFLKEKEKLSPQLIKEEMFSSDPVYFKDRNFIYKGQWKSTTNSKFPYLFHGKGIFLDISNGLLVEGLFNQSKLFYGRVYASDGSFYEGDIVNNKAHGQGRFVDSKGINFISGWNENVRVRNGSILFPNNTRYAGKFEDDMLNDESGSVQWATFKYSGRICNYILEGDGCLDTPNGRYAGEFSNNTFHGRGKYTYKSGIILEANFVNGMPIEGTFTFPNNQTLRCKFRNGKVNGEGIFSNNQKTYEFRFGKISTQDEIDTVLAKNISFFEYDETFTEGFIEKNNLEHFYIESNEEKIVSSFGTPIVFLKDIFPDMIHSFATSIK